LCHVIQHMLVNQNGYHFLSSCEQLLIKQLCMVQIPQNMIPSNFVVILIVLCH